MTYVSSLWYRFKDQHEPWTKHCTDRTTVLHSKLYMYDNYCQQLQWQIVLRE